jgi:hypothetical protein
MVFAPWLSSLPELEKVLFSLPFLSEKVILGLRGKHERDDFGRTFRGA